MKRIIALVGHAHCGKTTLAESILFTSGATTRKGDVMHGNSVSDFNDDEIERKISINASFLRVNFQGHTIQIIDTPGYSDFVGETIAALRAVDAAVVVVDAVNGVEVGTEDIWERLDSLNMPRIIFINKADKSDANVAQAIKAIQENLSAKAHIIDFTSQELAEAVAETDDKLLEKYLEKGSLAPEEIKNALRASVVSGGLFPVLTGSALTDKGTKELLEAILNYLPSPIERPAFQVQDPDSKEMKAVLPSENGPFTGFIFKSMFDPHLGQLSLMRVVRGTMTPNADFYNIKANSKEHVNSITVLQGKEQVTVSQAACGDIVALPKLKNTHVSDSLTDVKEKCFLEPIVFPEPSMSASIKPKTRADEEKISMSLSRLCEEDHTIKVHRDNETKEMIISGIGDLHLKVILDRMKRRYNVDVDLGTPKVSYRETINKKARFRYKYKKQSGGRGQYGDVELEVAPLPRSGIEYEFLNKIFGGAIPKNFIPSIEKGVKQAVTEGVLAGSHIVYVQVTVVDGSYHDVDSSDMAFQIAGAMAFKEAIRQANPVLLEPIMDVSILVPDEFIGHITGDISGRRGRVMGSEAKGKNQIIKAEIPLSEMFKYATDLRSMTGGRGSYTMRFAHYEQAPAKITEQVIASRKTTPSAA